MAAQNSKFKRFSGILRYLLCIHSLPSDPTTDIPATTTTDIPATTTTTIDIPTTTQVTTQGKTPGVVGRLMGLDSLPDPKKVFGRKEGHKGKGFLRPKSKEPKEKAKEITRKMRRSLRNEPMDLPSILKGYAGDESSYNVSGSESELTISTLKKSVHWSNRPRPSSLLSTESFVSREAKKRLSERWKMSQRYQNVGVVGKASRPENFYPMTGLDGSRDRFVSNNEIAEWDSPLGISRRDGWNSIRISSRLRSFATSCISFGGPKTNMQCETLDQDSYLMAGEAMNRGKNKAIRRNSNKKEDCSSRKIKSNNKKSQSSCRTYRDSTDSFGDEQFNLSQVEINLGKKDPAEQKSLVSHMRTHNINGKSSINDAEVDGGHADMYSESLDEELPSKPASCLSGNPTSSTPGPEDSKAQVPQIGPSEDETVQLQCPVLEPQSSASSKEASHSSLVLVLEAPFVEDVNIISPGSECFERVNADLHVLPMQLKLLKMESGANADGLMLTPSDKDVGQGFVSVSEDNEVFNEKYSNETTSLRSERKLLFDSINSGLFEMFHQFVDPLPWVKQPTGKVGLTRQKHGIGYELYKLLASEEKSMHEDVTKRVLDREMYEEKSMHENVTERHSFSKQFYGSVTKSDYIVLRLGFVMIHCRGNPKFNFHKYMIRALEDDFKKLLLAVGTKLEHVITQLAHEVTEKHIAIEGELVVQPSDNHFWVFVQVLCSFSTLPLYAIVTQARNILWTGFKHLTKPAREVVMLLQKIDNDNYPEVLSSKFQSKLLEIIDDRISWW
ncbi:unnamed protein product [Camellia sinensis]